MKTVSLLENERDDFILDHQAELILGNLVGSLSLLFADKELRDDVSIRLTEMMDYIVEAPELPVETVAMYGAISALLVDADEGNFRRYLDEVKNYVDAARAMQNIAPVDKLKVPEKPVEKPKAPEKGKEAKPDKKKLDAEEGEKV